jgi:hypothetical protein
MERKHIAKTGGGTDQRFRSRSKYARKASAALCGEPSQAGVAFMTKGDARNVVKGARLRPDWLDNLCPDCLKVLDQEPTP